MVPLQTVLKKLIRPTLSLTIYKIPTYELGILVSDWLIVSGLYRLFLLLDFEETWYVY